jgi:plastocyanin
MKKPVIIAIVVAVVVLGGLGYNLYIANNDEDVDPIATESTQSTNDTSVPEESTDTTPEDEAITIDNRAYGRESVTVKSGTTVTWTNQDSLDHDVTPDEETLEFSRSEMLSTGDSYSVTFTTPGTYTYHCTPHPDMTGTIIVTE